MSLTHRGTDWNVELLRVTRQAFLVVGMIAICGVAGAQQAQPDAQIEANVLKALASAPDLANQSITTKTVYGVVTLSGSVTDEHARTEAENLAANAHGVKKVVDELQLGSGAAPADSGQQTAQAAGPNGSGPAPLVLLSDGTYGPAPASQSTQTTGQPTGENPNDPAPGSAPAAIAQMNDPQHDPGVQPPASSTDGMPSQSGAAQTPNGYPPQSGYPQGGYPSAQGYPPAQGYPQPGQPATTAGNGQYPRPMYPYPQQTPYGYPQGQQPPAGYAPQQGQIVVGGQVAGQVVSIPAGALLRVRLNRTLASNRTQPGTTFDGVVMNDVVANGLVAIPRGATVQGKVVEAKSSGALTGRGEMSIQLTQVTLAGKTYPLNTDLWAHNGGDKTIETVNKTAGLGALGAIVGAVAGGGRGAAIGGGVGAAAGLGSSAASGGGQVYIPAEAIVVFHTAGENQVATVSEQEMQRLSYAAGPGGGQAPAPRGYRAYPGYYPGYPPPGYYPYPGYGYPNY